MDKGEELLEKYGSITSVAIDGYYKYSFELTVTTDRKFNLKVCTGGDADDIYRYDPTSFDWDDHLSAGEVNISLKKTK